MARRNIFSRIRDFFRGGNVNETSNIDYLRDIDRSSLDANQVATLEGMANEINSLAARNQELDTIRRQLLERSGRGVNFNVINSQVESITNERNYNEQRINELQNNIQNFNNSINNQPGPSSPPDVQPEETAPIIQNTETNNQPGPSSTPDVQPEEKKSEDIQVANQNQEVNETEFLVQTCARLLSVPYDKTNVNSIVYVKEMLNNYISRLEKTMTLTEIIDLIVKRSLSNISRDYVISELEKYGFDVSLVKKDTNTKTANNQKGIQSGGKRKRTIKKAQKMVNNSKIKQEIKSETGIEEDIDIQLPWNDDIHDDVISNETEKNSEIVDNSYMERFYSQGQPSTKDNDTLNNIDPYNMYVSMFNQSPVQSNIKQEQKIKEKNVSFENVKESIEKIINLVCQKAASDGYKDLSLENYQKALLFIVDKQYESYGEFINYLQNYINAALGKQTNGSLKLDEQVVMQVKSILDVLPKEVINEYNNIGHIQFLDKYFPEYELVQILNHNIKRRDLLSKGQGDIGIYKAEKKQEINHPNIDNVQKNHRNYTIRNLREGEEVLDVDDETKKLLQYSDNIKKKIANLTDKMEKYKEQGKENLAKDCEILLGYLQDHLESVKDVNRRRQSAYRSNDQKEREVLGNLQEMLKGDKITLLELQQFLEEKEKQEEAKDGKSM